MWILAYSSSISWTYHLNWRHNCRLDKARSYSKLASTQERWRNPKLLRLAGYYRRFVEGFSKISTPFTQLTQKEVKYACNEKCEQSFQELKARLTTTPILAMPTEFEKFVIYSDASKNKFGMYFDAGWEGNSLWSPATKKGMNTITQPTIWN